MKKRHYTITLSPKAIEILKERKKREGVPISTQVERLILESQKEGENG